MLSKRNILAVLVLILALIFGSFQERAKISVNNILNYSAPIYNYDSLTESERMVAMEDVLATKPKRFYTSQKMTPFFYKFDINELKKLKWVNTVFFILIHLILNGIILFLLFNEFKAVKYLAVTYLIFFGIAIGVYVIFGKVFENKQASYNFARKIVGFLQSQIPLMVFAVGYYLNKRTSS